MNQLIRKVYETPSHPGSFTSASQIQKIIQKKYKKSLKLKEIQDWLNKQRSYSLHKKIKHVFPRNKIIATYMDVQWQSDLMFLPDLAVYNDGFKIVLVCVDVLSRYLWVEPMKNKSGISTATALDAILRNARPRCPEKLQTDDGREYFNPHVAEILRRNNIKHFSVKSDLKAAIAERVIKTLKEKIYKYLDHTTPNNRYIDVLQDLADSYNQTIHTKLKMAPADVNEDTVGKAIWNLYGDLWNMDRNKKDLEFKIGDRVRISSARLPFRKGYKGNWSEEIFKIIKVKRVLPRNLFYLEDYNRDRIEGAFYNDELQKIEVPEKDMQYNIEKVIKKRTLPGGNKQYFVKWYGYSDKFNSWVDEKDII